MKKIVKNSTLVLILIFVFVMASAQSEEVPGIVVNHIPALTKTFIGSPSICILPNGDYVASHDHFGPGSTHNELGLTAIFKSTNKGRTWEKTSEINGQFWSNLFVHENKLYIMGTDKQYGNFVIRRSDDDGISWTSPTESANGLLLQGEYHTAPMPIIEYSGRLWRAMENAKSDTRAWGKRFSAMMISAPSDSDLLNGKNWTSTNSLPYDSTFLDGKFVGWLEGNAIVTPESKVINILRVETSEPGCDMCAVVKIRSDGTFATFDKNTGFMEFKGGSTKFNIRYDKKSKHYWTISNFAKQEFSHLIAARVRNTLVLKSSSDLKNWTVHKILLEHPDVEKHGFQYVDWQFDGPDIVFCQERHSMMNLAVHAIFTTQIT